MTRHAIAPAEGGAAFRVAPRPPREPRVLSLMPARILIVEDEEPLTLLLRYNLEAAGYAVDSAANGDDADAVAKQKRSTAKAESFGAGRLATTSP